jgi:hypothetical protein
MLTLNPHLNDRDSRLANLLEPAYHASFDVSPNSLQMAGLAFDESSLARLKLLQSEGFVMIFQGKEYLREGYKLTREGKEWYEREFCVKPQ